MVMEGFKDYEAAKKKLANAHFPKGLVAFGSARLPMTDSHIKEVEEISALCAKRILAKGKNISFITGGGPSVMTAWLKPAYELGASTGGMALVLPHEREEDRLKFCNQETSCVLETFEARKAIMFDYAKCIVIFKGGFGTMDELYSALTLMKTNRMPEVPIFIYPASFYRDVLNFKEFINAKTIRPDEGDMMKFMNSKEELIENLYKFIDEDRE